MLKPHFSLLLFCLLTSVLSQQKSTITYDRVPIYYESAGLHILADASEKPLQTSNPLTKALVSLYNSHTVLPLNCIDFDKFLLFKFNKCSKLSSIDKTTIEYPRFNVTASETYEAAISLGKGGWKLSNNALGADSCAAKGEFVGSKKKLIIGLGTSGPASTNLKSKVFSISFLSTRLRDLHSNPGEIIFGFNPILAVSGAFQSFQATENWEIALNSAKLSFGDKPITFSGRLIFDINAKSMGFPLTVFEELVKQFAQVSGLECQKAWEQPFCKPYYNTSLPNLELTFEGKTIVIPPQVYSTYAPLSNGTSLNMQVLTTTTSGITHVNPSFANAIILDPKFMSYYYTVFNRTASPTIELYVRSNHDEEAENAKEKKETKNVLMLSALGISVVLALVTAYKKFGKKKQTETSYLQFPDERHGSFHQTL